MRITIFHIFEDIRYHPPISRQYYATESLPFFSLFIPYISLGCMEQVLLM